MPNTACRIGKGMTALCRGRHATGEVVADAEAIFATMGRTVEIDEALMNAATGLSASGPAFVYIILEALAEAGVRAGLPRQVSMLLGTQATLGAAAMVLETGQHPAMLKEEVTTPAGCTIDGILELETGGIRATLIRAVCTAAEKAGLMAPASKRVGRG
jgi:pyrroline-5-carboxylate reductase